MRIEVVTIPYRYDEPDEGLGLGPAALLDAGLLSRIPRTPKPPAPRRADLAPEDREDGATAVNIGRLGARTAELVAEARRNGSGVLVLAGDDTAAIGVVAGVERAAPGQRVGVVWIDAHPDFNTPETSFSGILAGMPVAILAGLAGPKWRDAAGLLSPVPTDRIIVAGIRETDDQEAALINATSVKQVKTSQLGDMDAFREMVNRLAGRCDALSVHVDLDVLDPRFVPSASTPSAGGLSPIEAARVLGAVLATGKVATLAVAGLNPGAGARGRTSTESTIALLEQALPHWTATPQPAS